MRRDEILPGGCLAPLWRGRDAVLPKDVSNRPVGNGMTQIGQSSHDPVITPTGIFSGHPDDKFHNFVGDGWTTGAVPVFRSVRTSVRSNGDTTQGSFPAWPPWALPRGPCDRAVFRAPPGSTFVDQSVVLWAANARVRFCSLRSDTHFEEGASGSRALLHTSKVAPDGNRS